MKRFPLFKTRLFKRAFLEILLIFIGVNLSVGFTNWNQEKKERQIEINILKEIYHDMDEDIKDLDSARSWFIKRNKAFHILEETLQKNLPMDDTLKKYLPRIIGSSYMNRNQVAYENYKSRGLEFVSNDSLRMIIMRYYGEKLPWLFKNEDFWDEFSGKYIEPLFIKHFNFETQSPYNFNKMRKEKILPSITSIGKSLTNKMTQNQSSMINSSSEIKQNIEKELLQLTGKEWHKY